MATIAFSGISSNNNPRVKSLSSGFGVIIAEPSIKY